MKLYLFVLSIFGQSIIWSAGEPQLELSLKAVLSYRFKRSLYIPLIGGSYDQQFSDLRKRFAMLRQDSNDERVTHEKLIMSIADFNAKKCQLSQEISTSEDIIDIKNLHRLEKEIQRIENTL